MGSFLSALLLGGSQGIMAPPEMVQGAEADGKVPRRDASPAFGEEGGGTVQRQGRRHRVVHPDLAAFTRSPPPRRLWLSRRRPKPPPPSPPRRAVARKDEDANGVRYDCGFDDEDEDEGDGIAPPQLVWGKVKCYPWWPGQVVDPADASSLAARQQQRPRGAALVAFFDKTFAWTDALRPFKAADFRRFADQSALSPFASAVDAALAEVARRAEAGLSCGCAAGSGSQQVVAVIDNAGVREGARGAVVDAASAREAFRGEAFLGYVSALAAAPLAGGAERVDVAIATAQLRAFSRWRGSLGTGLPEYTCFHGIIDDGVASASARARKRRSRSGGDDGSASGRRAKKMARRSGNAAAWDDALKVDDSAAFPAEPASPQISTRMGTLMNQAAKKMSLSPVVLRRSPNNYALPVVLQPQVARCTTSVVLAGELPPPPMNNRAPAPPPPAALGDDDRTFKTPPPADDDEQAGLVLNFSSASAVPSPRDLTTIFSQFGPVKEATVAENSAAALVVFKRRAHAKEAFARTAKIGAFSASLVSFRLTYSLPPATAAAGPQLQLP